MDSLRNQVVIEGKLGKIAVRNGIGKRGPYVVTTGTVTTKTPMGYNAMLAVEAWNETARELESFGNGAWIRVAGWLKCNYYKGRKGNRFGASINVTRIDPIAIPEDAGHLAKPSQDPAAGLLGVDDGQAGEFF